jgi:chromosomal replication initiation ATPase DnaA
MAKIDFESLWDKAMNLLKAELGEGEFSAWFTDVRYLRAGENSIVVGCPSSFYLERVKKSYQKNIITKLKDLYEGDISLELEVLPDNGVKKADTARKTNAADKGEDA